MRSPGSRWSGVQIFVVVLFGQTVSMFGSALSRFATGIWIYQQTGSASQFALATFFAVAPPVLLLPFVGSLVDRWDRRQAMILADVGAGLGTLLLAFLMWTGRAELWHFYCVIGSNAAFGTLQFPAFTASTTLLLSREQLSRGNGMAMFSHSLVSLLSPMASGFLAGTLQLEHIFLIDGATCLFAILTLLAIRIPHPAKAGAEEARSTLLAGALYGWSYIYSRPGLLGLLLLFSSINFVTGMVQTLIIPMVLSFAPSAVLGIVVTGGGLGMLAGGTLMSFWKGPQHRVRTILAVLVLQGVVLLFGGARPHAGLIAMAAFVYLACIPVINACSQTIWQSKVSPAVQGRVFAIRLMVSSAALPLATLVSGPLADHVFEPLLAPGGPLAGSVGRILGVGPGRGIGLLLIVLGALVVLATAFGYRRLALKNLEADIPDAFTQAT